MNESIEYHYRVYYDEIGNVVSYAMGDVEHYANLAWISITREQYAEANPNCLVIDRELVKPLRHTVYLRMKKTTKTKDAMKTSADDMCIIVQDDIEQPTAYYKVTAYEKISRCA